MRKEDHTYRLLEMAANGDGYIRYRRSFASDSIYKAGDETVVFNEDWYEAIQILSAEGFIEIVAGDPDKPTIHKLTRNGYGVVGIQPPAEFDDGEDEEQLRI